jgi:hypothetical protein
MSCRRTVTLVTGPTADPVTLDEAKNYARITATAEDAIIAAYITSATSFAEQYLRRSLITQTRKLTLDLPGYGWARDLPEGVYDLPSSAACGDLPRVIELPYGPIQAVSAVTTYDTDNTSSTFDSSNYQVDTAGARLYLSDSAFWPTGLRNYAACEITFTAGYGSTSTSIPMPIKTGILMHVQRMYDARIVCELPQECRSLYDAYRIRDGLSA